MKWQSEKHPLNLHKIQQLIIAQGCAIIWFLSQLGVKMSEDFMKSFLNLFNGKVGKVVEEEIVWNECEVVWNGKKYDVGDCVGDIEELNLDECEEVILNKSDGYRGNGCYEGIVTKDGKLFVLDIINDFLYYELVEK